MKEAKFRQCSVTRLKCLRPRTIPKVRAIIEEELAGCLKTLATIDVVLAKIGY